MKKITFLSVITLLLTNCDPRIPAQSLDLKIKDLIVVTQQDSVNYHFTYNSGNKLENVTRDGAGYARLSYTGSQVSVIRSNDTTVLFVNASNLIDSIKYKYLGSSKYFYRNSNEQLDSIKKNSMFAKNYIATKLRSGYNITINEEQHDYSCSIGVACSEIAQDTSTYTTLNNQSNLPDQFVGISFVQYGILTTSFIDLDDLFLAQQSGVFPYFPHDRLRQFWITHGVYQYYVSGVYPFRIRFVYVRDALNRVTKITEYDTEQSDITPVRTYYMKY